MGRPMRLELTRVGLLVELANRYTTLERIEFTSVNNITFYLLLSLLRAVLCLFFE